MAGVVAGDDALIGSNCILAPLVERRAGQPRRIDEVGCAPRLRRRPARHHVGGLELCLGHRPGRGNGGPHQRGAGPVAPGSRPCPAAARPIATTPTCQAPRRRSSRRQARSAFGPSPLILPASGLFFRRPVQKFGHLVQATDLGPGAKGAVAGDLVMFNGLRGRHQASIQRRRTLEGFDDFLGPRQATALTSTAAAGELRAFGLRAAPSPQGRARLRPPADADERAVASLVHQTERVNAEALDHAEGSRDRAVRHLPHDQMYGFRSAFSHAHGPSAEKRHLAISRRRRRSVLSGYA